jgi:hypothetical protein
MITTSQPEATPSIQQLLPIFQQMLPAPFIQDLANTAYSPKRCYQRLFGPLLLVWCLVFQRLNQDHSCDAVLSHLGSKATDHLEDQHQEPLSQRLRSESTSGFCQARQRLPLAVLEEVLHHTAQQIQQMAAESAFWRGHPVALLDGTTILLYPFGDLASHYGQYGNHLGPCYCVGMRVVSAFCLLTGALLGLAEGSLHQSEQDLARQVLAQLPVGSICIGDQNFGVFSVAQVARQHMVFVLLRLSASRARALAQRSLHCGIDSKVPWSASREDQCDPELSLLPIEGRLIYVRLQRDGFRPLDLYFFTTLMDEVCYTVEALVQLYGQRWQVELDLRYVKDTLDLGLLYAKSVDTVRKELYGGFIAYNLIRAYMNEAAQRAGVSPLRLCFSQCWRRIRDTLAGLRPTDSHQHVQQEWECLLSRLAKCLIPKRPRYRVEPRAVRKHRSLYPPLKGSRDAARQRARQQLQGASKT